VWGTPLVVDLQCISVMKLKKICVERVYSGPGLVASKCPLCMLIVDRRVVEKILTRLGQKLDEEVSVSVSVKI